MATVRFKDADEPKPNAWPLARVLSWALLFASLVFGLIVFASQ
jgi:hypothetical protein